MSTNDHTLQTANNSGFPLQIAIERQVRQTSGQHGWSVRYSEHSWTNAAEGQSGFIDIVLEDRHRSTFLVVECKRVRDAEWVFLNSLGRAPVERNAKGWVSHYSSGSMVRFGWEELDPSPGTVEAHYCAIRGQSSGDRTTLMERVGSELIVATEALAAEERDLRSDKHPSIRFYLSLIVTTADLKLASFDPSKVSLEDGTLSDAEFTSVPYIRFRKQLTTRRLPLSPKEYEYSVNVPYLKEHTVFVVRADALPAFLGDLAITDSTLRRFNIP